MEWRCIECQEKFRPNDPCPVHNRTGLGIHDCVCIERLDAPANGGDEFGSSSNSNRERTDMRESEPPQRCKACHFALQSDFGPNPHREADAGTEEDEEPPLGAAEAWCRDQWEDEDGEEASSEEVPEEEASGEEAAGEEAGEEASVEEAA